MDSREYTQANCARDQGRLYDEYQHLLDAGLYDRAHAIAVSSLGPEAVLRKDYDLVHRLFGVFVDKDVEAWNRGGRVSGE